MADQAKTLVIEGAHLIFRNFSGKEGPYNKEGSRNVGVLLEDEAITQQMIADGWNVKYLKVREEGDPPQAYIPVAVGYDYYPPRIVLISGDIRTEITEHTVEMVDWANIQNADLMLRGHQWEVNGKTGLKAYLKSLYIIVEVDYLEQKYMIKPDGGS